MHSFKLPRLTNLITSFCNIVENYEYDIKENFISFSIIDIPPDINNALEAEGMSPTWLTGWVLAELSIDCKSVDTQHEVRHYTNVQDLYHLYINEDDGNFVSGFNHYLYHKQLEKISDLNWKLIRQIPLEDPYNFYYIHRHKIIYSNVNYSSINKLIAQIPDFIDLFIANDYKSLLAVLILCLLKTKDCGICFIKLPLIWNTTIINVIIYCCTISDCKLIILPWSGIYLELRNIDISIFDNNYKYLMDCLRENKNIFPENIIQDNREIIDIMKQSRNWEAFHPNIKYLDGWIDTKNIIALNNYQSVFSLTK